MMKKVYVAWTDSGLSLLGNVWQTEEEIDNIVENIQTTETVGFLLKETDDWIVLVQTVNEDQYRGGYVIYKKNIVFMDDLDKRRECESISSV